jgi:N-acetylglucosamine-6-sulfatase
MAKPLIASIAACALLIALVAVPDSAPADPPAAKPNVILITTDDQTLEEMWALPRTAAWLGAPSGGATFKRAYVSFPLCCPSRATILSGQYMHNNGVRGNVAPSGGWEAFRGVGTEARALPTWLQGAGYYTVQIGKYMNGWSGTAPIPPGWDEWYGKVSDYDSAVYGHRIYFNYQLREDPPADGGVPCPTAEPTRPGEPFTCTYHSSAADYQTDVLRDKAVEAIHRLGGDENPRRPFFMNLAFNAPHSPYIPAPRHAGQYAGVEITKPRGSNEKRISDKPRFLRRLPRLGRGKLAAIDARRRDRAEMLISVDEAIYAVIGALSAENELGNTYLIFTSDNGYFDGQHRIRRGKYLPHEPSSHVPLLIRGPAVPPGAASDELVSNVDIAETIRAVAGATASVAQDGRSLLPFAADPGLSSTRPILLEGDTGPGIDDDGAEDPDVVDQRRLRKFRKKLKKEKRALRRDCKRLKRKSPKRALLCFRRGVRNLEQEPTESDYDLRAPAFRSLRTDRYQLTLYATGEVELYDMSRDPAQLRSLHDSRRYKRVRKWMLAKLNRLSTCAGASCTEQIGREPRRLKKRDLGKGK